MKKEEKTFERKDALLDAALDEFTERSYEEASLNTIIKNAGISKGTFYYHFEDKQALYLFLLEASAQKKWAFIADKLGTAGEGAGAQDIFEKFRLQSRLAAEFAGVYPKYHRLSRMFAKEKGSRIYDTAKAVLGVSTEAMLEELIVGAIQNGDFKETFSKDFLVKTISFLLLHFDEIFYTPEDFELERMLQNLDSFVEFLKYGLSRHAEL
jgi:AcrR family transcriptional regulator